MSATSPTIYDDPRYDLNWSYTVHVGGEQIDAILLTDYTHTDGPNIDLLVGDLAFRGQLPDSRNRNHWKYTPITWWVKAHILREARGLTIEGISEYLQNNPDTALELGFRNQQANHAAPDPPGYTRLYEMWEDEFSDRLKAACMVIAERLVETARHLGIPAPERSFTPDPDPDVQVDEDDVDDRNPTVRELTVDKTRDIWKTAKPFILKHWRLKRHHNAQVPEHTFFDAHAHMAAADDLFPESGMDAVYARGEHDRVHHPSTHRRELKRFGIDEIRMYMHCVVKELIAKARREGELVGSLAVAIDITKGHPWTGAIETEDDGDNAEPWVLGYLNDNASQTQYYFQWASVQIVGLDIPLVLDALPVPRGMERGDIVDELLSIATSLVDDIEIVYMDRGFDSVACKEACDKHNVYYLNAARIEQDDENPDEMRNEGETFRLITQRTLDTRKPDRKTVYLPSSRATSDDSDDDDEDEESQRQKLIAEFDLDEDEFDAATLEHIIESLREAVDVDDIVEDEGDDGEISITKFETNHPYISEDVDGERDVQQMIARHVRRYKNRWGVENGYKKIKQFLPRSGSKDHVLRFFNFAFAATLYNCWRLVDLLVKLEVEDDPDYAPLVKAVTFREIAEQYYGLAGIPPPDW